jgi:hypothetical protein
MFPQLQSAGFKMYSLVVIIRKMYEKSIKNILIYEGISTEMQQGAKP